MKSPEKALRDSLRFQLSLLKLAVVPHGNPRQDGVAEAAAELAKLAEKVQSRNGHGAGNRIRA